MMSLFGGLLATLGMYLLIRQRKLNFGSLGIGVCGAFLHNCGQLLVALFLVSDAVYGYFPVLTLSSLVTGSVTGLVYYLIMPALLKIPLAGGSNQ